MGLDCHHDASCGRDRDLGHCLGGLGEAVCLDPDEGIAEYKRGRFLKGDGCFGDGFLKVGVR